MRKCYHCGELFSTLGSHKIHLAQEHQLGPRGRRRPKQVGIPNIVHYGARMRLKLSLAYNEAGHHRGTLEAA